MVWIVITVCPTCERRKEEQNGKNGDFCKTICSGVRNGPFSKIHRKISMHHLRRKCRERLMGISISTLNGRGDIDIIVKRSLHYATPRLAPDTDMYTALVSISSR